MTQLLVDDEKKGWSVAGMDEFLSEFEADFGMVLILKTIEFLGFFSWVSSSLLAFPFGLAKALPRTSECFLVVDVDDGLVLEIDSFRSPGGSLTNRFFGTASLEWFDTAKNKQERD